MRMLRLVHFPTYIWGIDNDNDGLLIIIMDASCKVGLTYFPTGFLPSNNIKLTLIFFYFKNFSWLQDFYVHRYKVS